MNFRPNNPRSVWIPVALLMLAIISIQTGAAFAKRLLPLLGAPGMTTLRLCFATIVLGLVCRPWRIRLSAQSLRVIALYGLTIGCMNLLIYLALTHIPLGVAVALEFLGPLTVAVLSSRKKLDFLWIGLAAVGVVILLPKSESHSGLAWHGIVYALGAGLCWALYIICGQRAGAVASSGAVTSIGMLVATLAIAPAGIANSGMMLLDTQFWPMALSIALLSSCVPYYLEMVALKSLPTKTFGILMSLEPAVAALSGLVILHEYLTATQCLAVISIMLASLGAVASARPAKATPELNV